MAWRHWIWSYLLFYLLLPRCMGSISISEESLQSLVNCSPWFPSLLEQKQNDCILYEGS